jgi:hypothetical protein
MTSDDIFYGLYLGLNSSFFVFSSASSSLLGCQLYRQWTVQLYPPLAGQIMMSAVLCQCYIDCDTMGNG